MSMLIYIRWALLLILLATLLLLVKQLVPQRGSSLGAADARLRLGTAERHKPLVDVSALRVDTNIDVDTEDYLSSTKWNREGVYISILRPQKFFIFAHSPRECIFISKPMQTSRTSFEAPAIGRLLRILNILRNPGRPSC